MNTPERIKKIYRLLYQKYGPQGWWPGDSSLECILGAILTQNTAWRNVEKALQNLKQSNLISVKSLSLVTTDELADLVRPSGYYNQKALKIKNFIRFLNDNYEGIIKNMLEEEASSLRNKLLEINGIGPETADSILLYCANKPIFVIDAYIYRIFSRHGIVPEQTNYHEMQEVFMDSLERDAKMFNEYHALVVKVGKEHCKKQKPQCTGCPLESDPHTE